MKIRDVMKTELYTIDINSPITQAIKKMEKYGIRRLLVTRKGEIIGIVTEKDIIRRLGAEKERKLAPTHIFVSSACTKGLITVETTDDVREAGMRMLKENVSSLIVKEDGRIVGIVTKADLLQVLFDSKQPVESVMRKLVHVSPDDSALMVRKIMLNKNLKELPVIEGNRIVGIVNEVELAKAMIGLRKTIEGADMRRRFKSLRVRDLMKVCTDWVDVKDGIGKVAKLMVEKGLNTLPVVKDGIPVGIVTKTDLVRACVASSKK